VVLGLLVVAALVSVFGPPVASDIAGLIGLLIVLLLLMNTFAGRTLQAAPEAERTAFFRRIYAPKDRR
jgi:hypothetical protein